MSPRAPNVLVLGAVLGQRPGGVRRHNVELLPRAARLLGERGGTLAILEGTTPIPDELREGIRCIPSNVPFHPPARRFLAEGRAARRAIRAADRTSSPFDLVHTAHLPTPRVPLPLTLTLHDLRDLELPTKKPLRRIAAPGLLKRSIRRAQQVVVVSETVRASLEARFAPRAVRLVPNAADHLPRLPREKAAARTGPLLHVGHVEPRKNLGLLLRALSLDHDLPRLLLAGAPKGEEEARLRELARSLGVADRVQFLGQVTDAALPRLYAQAACVVLPSFLEGFGIPVLEAQRAGTPLAISNTGALPEVAGPGVPTFPPDDPAAAAEAIRAALATDEDVLEERARRAERSSWEESARALVGAWCEAAGRGS
ncbi:MAG TPA: glycosyltransferase family 1 protein [Planctomycetes bacterium]|nr:glycosyltransferase family 1 protein [Planctomycetota bacterium]